MSRFSSVYRVAGDFISLLFPRVCQCCGDHLVRNEDVICTSCLIDIPLTGFHSRRDNDLEKSLWGRCYVERAAAWAWYQKGSRVQTLIHRFKYRGITSIGTYIGKLYGAVLAESGFLNGIDLIIPVPLHPSKKRKRGFNQSEIIAEAISEVSGIEFEPGVLRRVVKTSSQTSRSRMERWKNVEDIFDLVPGMLKPETHVLLVDDVITTGSTIEACVNCLKRLPDVKVSVVSAGFALTGSI
jgi:ComF family protein